jgi:hypothetical protein
MKYIFSLSFLSIALFFLSCTESTTTEPKDESTNETQEQSLEPARITIEETSKPVLFDFTSTGCPGCGSWGGPTFESIIDTEKNNIVPMAVHIKYGDNMITEVSEAIAENRTGQYFTPQLWVNNKNGVLLSGGRINGTGSLNQLNTEIDAVQTASPEVFAGVSLSSNETTVAIRYKTKTVNDLQGEYFVGVYLMENGINDRQSGNPNGSKDHNHVIRASNNGGFGTPISTEDLTASSESEEIIEFEMEDDWKMKNLYASIIVWKKLDVNYFVVNANNNLLF